MLVAVSVRAALSIRESEQVRGLLSSLRKNSHRIELICQLDMMLALSNGNHSNFMLKMLTGFIIDFSKSLIFRNLRISSAYNGTII